MSLNTTCPADEALRIWTTVPQGKWREELSTLPEYATVEGGVWPYRASVRDRLRLAYCTVKACRSFRYMGMHAGNRLVLIAPK